MKRIYTVLLILLFSALAFAGNPTFDVKTSKGDIKVQKGGKGSWEKVTKTTKLNSGDQLKLSAGAHLNLVHTSGNPIEVAKSGNYSVDKLAAKANTKKSDATKKFTNYLLDELGDSDDMLADDNLSDNMSTLGAVERAIPKFSPNDLVASFPRSSYATSDDVNFSWNPLSGVENYTFVIKDDLEEVIFEKPVSGTEISINLSDEELETGSCYYWSVKSGKKQSEELCIYRMTDNEKADYSTELSVLKSELDETQALDNMILASFYSQKKVVPEAIEAYNKAIEIAPEIDNYKLIYGKYLMSIGLVNEAKNLATK